MDRGRDEAGFSMTEVLASLGIFLIIATGLAATTISTIKANAIARNVSTATNLMEEKIEFFRALNPAVPADQQRLVGGQDRVNALAEAQGGYLRTWTVTNNQPKFGMATVQVTVEWSSPERQRVRGVTYICRLPNCA